MKVLSIIQPWASLIILGHKLIETRCWNTDFRGEFLLHSSAAKTAESRSYHLDFQQQFYTLQLPKYEDLPLGMIIGKVTLATTISTNHLKRNSTIEQGSDKWTLTNQEVAFGDYSEDRYAWCLKDPVIFNNPIPAKGQLRFWNYELDIFNQNN